MSQPSSCGTSKAAWRGDLSLLLEEQGSSAAGPGPSVITDAGGPANRLGERHPTWNSCWGHQGRPGSRFRLRSLVSRIRVAFHGVLPCRW